MNKKFLSLCIKICLLFFFGAMVLHGMQNNKEEFTLVNTIEPPSRQSFTPSMLLASGGKFLFIAYCSCGENDHFCQIVDVSDVYKLVGIKEIRFNNGADRIAEFGFYPSRNILFVSCLSRGLGKIGIVDVTDIDNPVIKKELKIDRNKKSSYRYARCFTVAARRNLFFDIERTGEGARLYGVTIKHNLSPLKLDKNCL